MPYTNYSYRKCFKNPEFYQLFSSFLSSSFNLELLRFYEQANDFNFLMTETNKEQKADTIVENFLKEDAPEQINISSVALEETIQRYQKAKQGEILFDSELFEPCLKIVRNDLKHDVFNRFKTHQIFLSFMEDKKKELGDRKFREVFLKDSERLEEKKDTEPEITEIFYKTDPFQLLTVNIIFGEQELKEAFPGTNVKMRNYLMNKMVMDIMKPFTGVENSTPYEIETNSLNLNSIFKTITKKKNFWDEKSVLRRFHKIDALRWIQNYFKLLCRDDAEIIFKLMESSNLVEPIGKIEGYYTKDYYTFKLKKKLVVVGCGAGGITVANILKEHMDVTVIDSKSVMSFINGYFKLFSNPMAIEDFEFPAESMVKGCKYVQSSVKNISPKAVYTEKEIFSYDYLVIASGSHYYIPYEIFHKSFTPNYPGYKFHDTNDKLFGSDIRVVVPYKKKSIIASYAFIREAKRVIIVGSGSVGCETAGELAVKYPQLEIVMITQDSKLLQKYQSTKTSKATFKILNQYGYIKFNFEKVITRVEGRFVYFKNLTDSVQVKYDEESLEGDVLINCMGLRPNTKMFKAFMYDSLNANGSVRVNEYFQVLSGKIVGDTDFRKKSETTSDDSDEQLSESTDTLHVNQLIEKINEKKTQRKSFSLQLEAVVPGYENIFAIGDIVRTGEEKLTYFAEKHGEAVAANILKMETCLNAEDFKLNTPRYKAETVIQCVGLGKKMVAFKGNKYIAHGSVTKLKKDFIGKQLQKLVEISKSTEKLK
jgi:NADH dehydrogenase FAD-containing subunit